MPERLSCFKAYDIRGKVPEELNEEIAYAVGRAIADFTGCASCVVGYDIRNSSKPLADAVIQGLIDAGVDAVDIGLCGTEMVYFATADGGHGAGIMVTASHNPPEYNGMKLVREESKPISGDTGLDEIERITREKAFQRSGHGKHIYHEDIYHEFVDHLLAIVDPAPLEDLRVLLNPGNGAAGVALDHLLPRIPLEATKMWWEPDGNFPNGVPNPILEENRGPTMEAIRKGNFDFGVAWDGDYDRCFFFDGEGNFIEGYYMVGVLAKDTLKHHIGAKIIHDPRLIWNTIEIVKQHGGIPIQCKTGHAFIKERMRAEQAEYGGEMSAHHYFKAHYYCDSGMIPFLQVARLVSQTGTPLGEMVADMMRKYPCSGEINSQVDNPQEAIRRVREHFPGGEEDWTDGLSLAFENWRFNLRPSNTEPVVRLNVESKGDPDLVKEKVDEILRVLRA
ncbi:MAG: phosphomannomutase [Fimbriimonadales bacterium]|nr:MAG: phosphomannomutase [Fimbriimonadales bacterium]